METSTGACSSAHEAVLMMRRPAELSAWEARNMRLPPAVQKLKDELRRAEQQLGTHIYSEPEEPTPRLQSPSHSHTRPRGMSRVEQTPSVTSRRPHTSMSLFTTRNSLHSSSLTRERPSSRGVVRPRPASFPSRRRVSMPVLRTRQYNDGDEPRIVALENPPVPGPEVREAWPSEVDEEQYSDEEADQFPAVVPPPPLLLSIPSTPGWSAEDTSGQSSANANHTSSGTNCPDSAASTIPMFVAGPIPASELLTIPKPKHMTKSFIANPRKQSKFRRGSSAQRQLEAKERRRQLEDQQLQRKLNSKARRKSASVPKVHSGNLASHWMAIVIAVQKYRVLDTYLQFLHTSRMLDDERQQQAIAVRTIECWYMVVRTKNKLHEKPGTAKTLRTFLHHIVRTQNTEKRRAATDLMAQFLTDFLPYKCITNSMRSFRERIVKLQRYIRSWIVCQHARLQLLYLAFERELRHRRTELLMQMKIAGRSLTYQHTPATSSERTPIQHLSFMHERVKILLDQAEGLLQNTGGKPRTREHKPLSVSMRFIMAIDGKRLEQLRTVLKNQRRRQAVADAEAYKQRTAAEARLVTTDDVKMMLAGSNERMMKIFFERAMGITRQRHTLFLLLTSGGLEEMRLVIDRELSSRVATRTLLRSCKSPGLSL